MPQYGVSVDESGRLPLVVRQRLAAEVQDPITEVGQALYSEIPEQVQAAVQADPNIAQKAADAAAQISAQNLLTPYAKTAEVTASIDAVGERALNTRVKALAAQLAANEARTVPGVYDTTIVASQLTSPNAVDPLETDLGASTMTAGSPDLLTTPTAHGLAIGDRVRFTNRSNMAYANPMPYYVRTVPSATTFTVYANNATIGGDADLGPNSGTCNVIKDVPETFTTWDRAAGPVTGDQTGDAAGDNVFITTTPHGLSVTEPVAFLSSTIGGVENNTTYWVRAVLTPFKFQISTTRARTAMLPFTSDGSATLAKSSGKFRNLRFPVIPRSFAYPAYQIAGQDDRWIGVGNGVVTGSFPERRARVANDRLSLHIYRSGSGVTDVFVDGVFFRSITDAQLAAAGISAGSIGAIGLYFPDPNPRVLSVLGADLAAIKIAKASQITAPVDGARTRVVVAGDSFTEGTGAAPGKGYVNVAAGLLRNVNVIPLGSGSTGYESDGTRTAWKNTYQSVSNSLPDVAVWALGINDASKPLGAVMAAAAACWDGVAAAAPNVLQVVFGPWPNGGGAGVQQTLIDLDAALKAEADTRGHPFFSPIREGVTFTRADATHPDTAGHRKLAVWWAAHMEQVLAV